MTLTYTTAKPKGHLHTCVNCHTTWACLEAKPLGRCPITVAKKVNGDGPWCLLCLHLEMAARCAGLRHRPEIEDRVRALLQQLHALV